MRRRRSRNHSEGPSVLSGVLTILMKSVLLLVTLAAMAEVGAGIALDRLRRGTHAVADQWRDEDLIRLYDTATPQFYREILEEQQKLVRTTYAPMLDYRMSAAQGKQYHVDDLGVRSNGPQAERSAQGQVFVFGGSTVLGRGVADRETLPAQLEELLNGAGKSVRVLNLGTGDYGSEQERLLLEQMLISGQRPDLAVFVDGLTEFCDCRPGPVTAWSSSLSRLSADMTDEADDFRPHLVQLYQWFHGGRPSVQGQWGYPCDEEPNVQARIERMQANRRLVQALGERYGFRVLFVQQPVPVHRYDNARRPVRVTAEQLGNYMNAARGYARLSELHDGQQLPDPQPLWLAELEPPEGNAYIDPIHYSPRFNRAIAEAIFRHVQENALLP